MVKGDNECGKMLEEYSQYTAFFATHMGQCSYAARTYVPARKKNLGTRKKTLEKGGKLFVYDELDATHQMLLQESRLKEWASYKNFKAVSVISKKEAERLLDQGAESLPTQWIETDKNESLRSVAKPLPPKIQVAWWLEEIWNMGTAGQIAPK